MVDSPNCPWSSDLGDSPFKGARGILDQNLVFNLFLLIQPFKNSYGKNASFGKAA